MKIATLEVGGFHPAMIAMRLPMKSGDKSDSRYEYSDSDVDGDWGECWYEIGPKDHELSMKLIKAGSDHRKHIRLIDVWVEIQAPEYFFAQLATYRFGVDSVSSSLMHRGLKDEFTIDDFEVTDEIKQMLTPAAHENGSHLIYGDSNEYKIYRCGDRDYRVYASGKTGNKDAYEQALLWELTIERLNRLRESGSIETLRSAIPGSYQYTRIYKFSYEALRNIYHARKNHKLKQWHVFCDWIETLPYSEFITEPAS